MSQHRDATNNLARQVNASVDRGCSRLEDKTDFRSQESWRLLRADVDHREQRCHRLSERIRVVEEDLLRREHFFSLTLLTLMWPSLMDSFEEYPNSCRPGLAG